MSHGWRVALVWGICASILTLPAAVRRPQGYSSRAGEVDKKAGRKSTSWLSSSDRADRAVRKSRTIPNQDATKIRTPKRRGIRRNRSDTISGRCR